MSSSRLFLFATICLVGTTACGSSSNQDLFHGATTGSGGAASGSGGDATSGAAGTAGSGSGGTTASGGNAGTGGDNLGAGGLGVAGAGGSPADGGTGGVPATGGSSGAGGIVLGDGGFGSGGEGAGGASSGGAAGAGGTTANGVVCGSAVCGVGEQCCVSGNTRKCVAVGGSCCTGFGCTATTVTCDEQADCVDGTVCCAIVTYSGLSARVSTIGCESTCNRATIDYLVCDPNGSNICNSQTSCSSALLISGFDVCQ